MLINTLCQKTFILQCVKKKIQVPKHIENIDEEASSLDSFYNDPAVDKLADDIIDGTLI